ncbi:MAG: phytoene desaturase [Spirochaetales bacterium]|nr:phytoene desaturase [Spirochaetales bacterium]
MAERSVAVVGAGLGGLSAAIRLAHAGYAVDLYDQQAMVGGKAGTKRRHGFRFDTGPSLLTMPAVFRQLFEEVGRRLEEHLELLPLAPICHYFYPDGTVLYSYSDLERFGREISAKTLDDTQALERYLDYGRKIYDNTAELFLWSSLHELSSYLGAFSLKSLLNMGKIDAFRSMDAANRSFFKDPRLVQLFDRYATYNGSSPYKVPATLNIIPYVEYGLGAYAVGGGIYSIPDALGRLADGLGVRVILDMRVEKILHRNGRIRGIRVGGEELGYDVVVSNADVLRTYEDLLEDPEARLARRYRALEPSSSGLVFLWGLKESCPELGVNNIFFSGDYPGEFRELFVERVCPTDPTVYVNITSKVTPGDAPENGENWFVLINAPCNAGQDWEAEVAASRERVLSRVEGALGRRLEGAIVTEEVLSPPEIERNTGSRLGSLYGISSNTSMAAFLRHPNRSRRYRGLYFCGASVHPGGGMPLAILSGKIAADLIRRREGGGE